MMKRPDADIWKVICFEIRSWVGRKFKNSRIEPFPDRKTYVDLGFGANYSPGWINVDFFWFRFNPFKKHTNLPDVGADLRYPLNCNDSCIDGCYCGHTLEHLSYEHARSLISEIYRILKPSSWLRINVPDFDLYLAFCKGETVRSEFRQEYRDGLEAMHCLMQKHGHVSVWNERLLSSTLAEAGFTSIRKVQYGIEGTDPHLIKEEDVRSWQTLVLEARK